MVINCIFFKLQIFQTPSLPAMTVATRTVRLANFKCISGAVLEHRKRYRISARFVSRLRNGNILNLFLFSKFIIIVVCIFFSALNRWSCAIFTMLACQRWALCGSFPFSIALHTAHFVSVSFSFGLTFSLSPL